MVVPALLLLAPGNPLKATYEVRRDGSPWGEAVLFRRLTEDGVKETTIRLTVQAIETRIIAVWEKDGRPRRRWTEVRHEDKPVSTEVVRFDKDGAEAVLDRKGERSVKRVKLAATAPRREVMETWFISVTPKPGDTYDCFSFEGGAWKGRHTTYVGPARGGHLVRTTEGQRTIESVLDEQGMPIEIIDGTTVFRRKED